MLHRSKDSNLIRGDELGSEGIHIDSSHHDIGAKRSKGVTDKTAKVGWKWVTAYKAKDTMLLDGVDEFQT